MVVLQMNGANATSVLSGCLMPGQQNIYLVNIQLTVKRVLSFRKIAVIFSVTCLLNPLDQYQKKDG
jgi:hypothetical protein